MSSDARPSTSIARRYAAQVAAISAALLITSGGVEMYFSFQEARQDMARLQAAQADAAAREIEQYLRGIEVGLHQVTRLPWGTQGFGPAQKREEFHRLMALFPSVMELRDLSAVGQELLFVSRTELDRVAEPSQRAAAPAQSLALGFGSTQFRDGAEPFVTLTLASAGQPVKTQASINLRFLVDVVSGLRVGRQGQTYVVDAANRLVAHPKATQVLRQLDLGESHAIKAARLALQTQGHGFAALDSFDVEGRPVIATVAALASVPGWLVFVEQPRSEALEAAFATLRRTLLLFGLGGGLAVFAAALYARRLARPIVELRRAAGQIAAGDLASRIELSSGDELELLANDFNQMASQLQASYAGLEAKVAARTAELLLAKSEAERANLAKTRFLAAASHDLRQPLHTVGLLVSLLRERLKGREALELADKVYRSVDTLEALFGGLLDISKLDAGAITARPESFALDGLLAHLENSYAAQAEARGLRLAVRRCGLTVRSDPVLLERIVGNLISNAIRYTDQGGVLLLCRRRGQEVALQVWDTGRGIAAAKWEDVFDEFYRINEPAGHAGAAVGDGAQGLGLGLAIVKRSAQLLGHALTLKSRLGRGSMFEVRVPLVPQLLGGTAQAAPCTELDSPSQLAGSFVVIVDDDRDNREALAALCSQSGMHTLCCASIQQACEQVTQHLRAPDLIISDFNLGAQCDGSDGFDVIARLREVLGECVPAIIVTADAGACASQRAAACGALMFSKPANAERLLAGIRAALAAGAKEAGQAD